MEPISDQEKAAQIRKLYELHQSGALSRAEFENAKRRVLGETATRRHTLPPTPYSLPQKPYETPRERSALFHFAGGFVLAIVGLVALVIVGVVAAAIFGGGSDDNGSPASTGRVFENARVVQVTRAADDPPTEIVRLHGAVILHGDYATETEFGVDCQGAFPREFVENGVMLRVQAEGQKYLGPYELVYGRGSGEGTCEFSFTGDIHLSDSYQIIFDKDDGGFPHQITTCYADEVWEGNGMVFMQLHMNPEKQFGECIYPDHLD